jgi:hypothetical protein
MVLPSKTIKHLPGLRISPLGVVPQSDRWPCTIVDYSFYRINDDTVPLTPETDLQFGYALP